MLTDYLDQSFQLTLLLMLKSNDLRVPLNTLFQNYFEETFGYMLLSLHSLANNTINYRYMYVNTNSTHNSIHTSLVFIYKVEFIHLKSSSKN